MVTDHAHLIALNRFTGDLQRLQTLIRRELCGSLVVFSAVYLWLYSRLVSWRRPSWLLLPSIGRHGRRK